jgi:hypothetical protein
MIGLPGAGAPIDPPPTPCAGRVPSVGIEQVGFDERRSGVAIESSGRTRDHGAVRADQQELVATVVPSANTTSWLASPRVGAPVF